MIADDAAKTKLARYFKLKLKDCRGDYDITITTNDQRQILRYYVHEARYRLLPEEVCPEVKTVKHGRECGVVAGAVSVQPLVNDGTPHRNGLL